METPITDTGAMAPTTTELSPYGWFATLWPVAVLFHLAGNDFNLLSLTTVGFLQIPFLFAAIAMLLRPSPAMALLLAGTHVPVVIAKLPVVGNHEVLLLLMHIAVILAVATRGKDWLAAVVPPLRWVLLIAYSAIAFSKLNSSFVDRSVSCAVVFADELGDWVNVSVSGSAALSAMVIAGVLVTEISIPIMLMTRRLRRFGVVVGLCFHTLLALEPVGHVLDFTSVLFVLFCLFLTPPTSAALSTAINRVKQSAGTTRIAALLVVMVGGNIVTYRLRVAGYDAPRWLFDYPFFLAYAGFMLCTVTPATRRQPTAPKLALRTAPAMAVVVLLTSLNAVSPYVELRTAGAFNMYSNLMVDDGRTNHFLLPGTLPLRDAPNLYAYTAEPGSRIGLDVYDQAGLVIPEANLAQWANIFPDLDVAAQLVRGDGAPTTIGVQDLAADVNASDSLIERIAYIRAIDAEGPTSCLRYWGAAH